VVFVVRYSGWRSGCGTLESAAYAHRGENIVIRVGGGSGITSKDTTSADG